MARKDYPAHLAEVPMFSACNKKELGQVSRLADELSFDEGDTLVKEGDPGQEFFILLSGTAAVKRKNRVVAKIGAGDWFGELALLDRAPRNASVVATSPVKVLVLSQRAFKGLLAEVPTISNRLLTGMARRLHELDAKV